jgi:type II secretory pathway pseudopilin PulG
MNERDSRRRCGAGAFTLIELLVAVGVLTLIVLVLFRIFDQTQRALRSNVAQVDVMEGGRALMELLRRELEQVEAVGDWRYVNFFVGLSAPPRSMDLPGDTARTNAFHELYFLSRDRQSGTNKLWQATVYRVLTVTNLTPMALENRVLATNLATEGVGWLARRTQLMDLAFPETYLGVEQLRMSTTAEALGQHQRVVNGVVHFRVTPLDRQGMPIFLMAAGVYGGGVIVTNNRVGWQPPPDRAELTERDHYFTGDRLPAFLQVELGLLEPQVVERWHSLANPAAKARFLRNQAARVHFFQQRIPIRSAPSLMPST